jgi:hypothetical protein
MGDWYLQDVTKLWESQLNIASGIKMSTQNHRTGIPHIAIDLLEIHLQSYFATDDSLFFSHILPALMKYHEEHERFNFAYGTRIAIGPNKTYLFIHGLSETDTEYTSQVINVIISKEDAQGKVNL